MHFFGNMFTILIESYSIKKKLKEIFNEQMKTNMLVYND